MKHYLPFKSVLNCKATVFRRNDICLGTEIVIRGLGLSGIQAELFGWGARAMPPTTPALTRHIFVLTLHLPRQCQHLLK